MDGNVLGLAAQIVSAHVANNEVSLDDLPKLINEVHRALTNAAHAPATTKMCEPAVPVKKSVTAEHIACLECGKHFSMLKRHLNTDHRLTPDEYRRKWDLPRSYPLVAPNYAKTRSTLAKTIGLGRRKAAPTKNTGRKSARRS